MEMKSGEYSQVATDEKDPTAKVEKEKGRSWKGWQAFAALWLARTMNKMSDSYISSILSTVERHFGLNTKSMSMVFAANDITSILIVLPLVFYFNRKNKAFWTGIGQVTIAIAGLLPLLAFLAIPKVEEEQVQEEKEVELCLEENFREALIERASANAAVLGVTQIAALGLFFLCKLMMGVASATYWTLGVAYMVDAISPMAVPAALGLCYIAGYLGGFFGSLLASACLSQDKWWLGWPIMSVCQATVAFLLFRLPANIREGVQVEPSLELVSNTLRRLFNNKILIFDTLSMVFFLFSTTNGSYMAKFVEFQFHVSPSKASLVSGSTKMIGNIVALSISTLVVSYFKPSARSLALYNFVSDLVAVLVTLSLIFVDCGSSADLLTPSSCLACSCSPSLNPVCNLATNKTYTSGCAAGCNLFNSTSDLFSGCSCAAGANLVAGFCPTDCSSSLFYFMLITFLLSLIMTMGKVGNLLVHIRCVDEDDKALGMAIQEVFIALFAFIPGELMFGGLVDSSCTLWSPGGSCSSYDTTTLRIGLFGGAAVVSFLAAVFDGLVWRGVRELQIY